MRVLILLWICALAVLLASSCAHSSEVVNRDPDVYAQEIVFWRMVALQSAERLGNLVIESCQCQGEPPFEQFATRRCHEAAELAVLLVSRANYHADMMEFLGGMRDTKPELPGPIQSHTDLCR